jgi:hypothetical protein
MCQIIVLCGKDINMVENALYLWLKVDEREERI